MDWINGMKNSLEYIEEHLTEEISYEEIARQACVSVFHFQRVFGILCGITVGEYIRNRRLTMAGEELTATNSKVIDVAIKYGYDSPDSFTKAFARFHGINPSQAKEYGNVLKTFAPLHIKFSLEGGGIMDYKLEVKEAITILGMKKVFEYDLAYKEIPEFWTEYFAKGYGDYVCGCLGVCIEDFPADKSFTYMIAELYDGTKIVKEGFSIYEIPGGEWAIFTSKGPIPETLQEVNTKIWSEWVPNSKEYEVTGGYNIEMYTAGDMKAKDYISEIWVPVKHRQVSLDK